MSGVWFTTSEDCLVTRVLLSGVVFVSEFLVVCSRPSTFLPSFDRALCRGNEGDGCRALKAAAGLCY